MKKFSKIFLAIALIMISTLSFALVGCGDTCEITVNSQTGGYVTGYGVYKRGEEVTIKAIPYTGYEFDYWTISPYYGNGIYPRKETKNPYSFRIHSDETEISVTPHFKTQGSSGSSSGSSSTTPQYAVIDLFTISLSSDVTLSSGQSFVCDAMYIKFNNSDNSEYRVDSGGIFLENKNGTYNRNKLYGYRHNSYADEVKIPLDEIADSKIKASISYTVGTTHRNDDLIIKYSPLRFSSIAAPRVNMIFVGKTYSYEFNIYFIYHLV